MKLDPKFNLSAGEIRFAENIIEENRRRNEIIVEMKRINAQQTKFDHDKTISKAPEVTLGNLVLLRSHYCPQNSKTLRKFKVIRRGPYIVHAICGNSVILKTTEGQILPDLYSIRKLDVIPKYRANFDPDYVNLTLEYFEDYVHICEDRILD